MDAQAAESAPSRPADRPPARIRLEPMTPERFETFAEESKRGFAGEQVASGTLPEAEAREYAESELARLLPDGLDTPGQHVWTVHDPESRQPGAEIGHLWITVELKSEGWQAFVYDVALHEGVRGRGLGRATMLAGEEEARALGATTMRLNVFGHNLAALRLYEGLGYTPASTMMARRLDSTEPMSASGPVVRLEVMTEPEYRAFRVAAEADYAGNIAESGMLPAREAAEKASEDFERLLPEGLATPGHELWSAYDGDRRVGMLWLHLEQKSDGLHAFGYDFSVREELRRQGYGRAVLVAGEAVCRDRGVVSVGLNVFGFNEGARALYEQMGFETTAILMRKQL